ncbi:MAG: hypothetical protein ACJA0E_000785 [Bermanella sp.]
MFYKYLLIILFSISATAHAADCSSAFSTLVNINGTLPIVDDVNGDTLSYQVNVQFSAADLDLLYAWTSAGADLRVTKSDGTALTFWIEDWDQANESASIWVSFVDTYAQSTRQIYLRYGNYNATSIADAPNAFLYPGIKFHVRPANGLTNNVNSGPANKSQAFNSFNSVSDNNNNNDGYGCGFIENFNAITKNSKFGTGNNFAAYSESFFNVDQAGKWWFRYGADFGYGGGLYIDGVALQEQWQTDLWWAGNWNNADVLQGSINLSPGYHKLEVLGFEGCCDGGITVQYLKPNNNPYENGTNTGSYVYSNISNDTNWTTFNSNTSGLDIYSRSCPGTLPTVSFGATSTCGLVDLEAANTNININNEWDIGVSQDVSIQIRNTDQASAALFNPTSTNITVPTGFVLNTFSGNNWSCDDSALASTNIIDCQFTLNDPNRIGINETSSQLVLTLTPSTSSVIGNNSISVEALFSNYDIDLSNNVYTTPITVIDEGILPAVSATCFEPKNGIWARFFDASENFINFRDIDNATDMQSFVNTFKLPTYLNGQTILENINGTENPYKNNDDYYLVVLEGYINAPVTGNYVFGIDGDDAVEFSLADTITSQRYGRHGPNNTANDQTSLRLEKGLHKIEFRMQEYTGGELYRLYWNTPLSNLEVIPAGNFVHCAGDIDIQMTTVLNVESDNINDDSLAKAIPGAIIKYTVTASNKGNLSPGDNDSTIITQNIDDSNELYVQDLDNAGQGPIKLLDTNSGLNYNYDATSGIDSFFFSIDGGVSFTDTVDTSNDYNNQVTHFQIRFNGSFKPTMDAVEPSFSYQYQVKLK